MTFSLDQRADDEGAHIVGSRPRVKNPFHFIKHIPGQPLSYLANPKVATKSIMRSLWRLHDPEGAPENPHEKHGPFLSGRRQVSEQNAESILGSQFFSVVRNPYARFVSGYLNKVDGQAWEKFSARLNRSPDSRPSANELLAILADTDPDKIERHFRPQHSNLLHGVAPLDFLGHLERIEEVAVFLQQFGIVLAPNMTNATGANARIFELLDKQAIGAIQRIYEKDFQCYGYSPDPMRIEPEAAPAASRDRSQLDKLLADVLRTNRESKRPKSFWQRWWPGR